jgi:IS30 family transposase
MKKSEALQQRKKLLQLIEQSTRAEIMARLGERMSRDFTDYFQDHLDKEDEIRRFVFGTDDLVELGLRFGILKPRKPKKERNSYKVKEGF